METSKYKRTTTGSNRAWSNEKRLMFSKQCKEAHKNGTWHKKAYISKEAVGLAISNGLKKASEEKKKVELEREERDIRESERQRMAKKRVEWTLEGGETTTLEPFFSDTQIRERLKIRKEKEKEKKRKEEVLDEGSPCFMLNISGNIRVRIINCLQKAKIETIGDLVQKSEQDLLKIKPFGRKCLRGVKTALADIGMSLEKPKSEEGNQVKLYTLNRKDNMDLKRDVIKFDAEDSDNRKHKATEGAKALSSEKTLKDRGVVLTQVNANTWLLFTEYVKQQSESSGIKLVKKTALDIAIKSIIRQPNFFQFALDLKKEDK